MTPEELLKPRYKVIADYPSNKLPVGFVCNRVAGDEVSWFDKYPHLFKKLEWWEDRDEKDMPKYVRCRDAFYKVTWENYLGIRPRTTDIENSNLSLDWHFKRNEFLPATEEEYLNQNKTTL